jgi:hypothetical protein
MAVDWKTDQSVTEQLRSWWFCLVSEIADIDLQRRTWLDLTNQNPHWSYIEFVSSYPDGDQMLQARREGWLTAAEFDSFNELRRTLDAYDPPGDDIYDNAAILDDPAWHSVVEAAEHAKRKLLSTTTDPREREVLLNSAPI